jgi:hypothetical protein
MWVVRALPCPVAKAGPEAIDRKFLLAKVTQHSSIAIFDRGVVRAPLRTTGLRRTWLSFAAGQNLRSTRPTLLTQSCFENMRLNALSVVRLLEKCRDEPRTLYLVLSDSTPKPSFFSRFLPRNLSFGLSISDPERRRVRTRWERKVAQVRNLEREPSWIPRAGSLLTVSRRRARPPATSDPSSTRS